MKRLNFCLTAICFLLTSSLFAQTPQEIETDLLQSFKEIEYWRDHSYDQTINVDIRYNSLNKANSDFAKKLKFYAEKYPATIAYAFKSLTRKYYYLDITTSSDNMFRIYSWNTWTGSQSHFFENVMEYKSGKGYKVIIDSTKALGDNRPNCHKIYTVMANDKIYYLVVYLYINDERDWDEGIRIYAIENGELVEDKLIKRDSGLYANLAYKVHSYSYGRPKISFNSTRNTIYLPLVDGNHHFTHKFTIYKFTGQYFERVKN